MIGRLRLSSIWSEDLNNLLPFYRDTLGLSVGMEAPGFVILGDPNGPGVALGTHSNVHGRAADPARHMVGFETDDIKGDCARLKTAGVKFIEEPNEMGAGWIATFEDPEGNLVQLLQFNSSGPA
jgi:predicted enzyme related to lactoylglutathione lyase